MNVKEVRQLPNEDLVIEINKRNASLFQIRLKAANEEVQRAGEIREMRRDIARMKTVLRERALEKTRSVEQESE
ncbi:MAG: 50S ribosomal protein L29 [Planctomycetia bacterium TMED53]|nr:MAG: 50S ribosomal protein L29 [Planctomycetia bacterium TMED53]